jgi:antitoxin component YwqK of YwqJK toxin-antitoxin module
VNILLDKGPAKKSYMNSMGGGIFLEHANTKYGLFENIAFPDYYDNGTLKRCILTQRNTVTIPCGTFIPQYVDDGKRKILTKSITFHKNGNILSIVLQDITPVNTSLGRIPAEMITFYESGEVRRIFPSFGILNAFWTEKDEHCISPELKMDLPFGSFNGKVINITFFETGELKSFTLWPDDTIIIKTPVGDIQTRIGFCLYPDGKIKSVEPYITVNVDTPIGIVPAFDPDALGIDGESNSVVFSEDGSIESLITSMVQITVTCHGGRKIVHSPTFKCSNYFDDKRAVVPMNISFLQGWVYFGQRRREDRDTKYKISECSFKIDHFDTQDCHNICDDCFH